MISFSMLVNSAMPLVLAWSSMVFWIPRVPTGGKNETESVKIGWLPSSRTTRVSVVVRQVGEKAASSQSKVVIRARPGLTVGSLLRISSRLRMSPGSQVYASR